MAFRNPTSFSEHHHDSARRRRSATAEEADTDARRREDDDASIALVDAIFDSGSEDAELADGPISPSAVRLAALAQNFSTRPPLIVMWIRERIDRLPNPAQ